MTARPTPEALSLVLKNGRRRKLVEWAAAWPRSPDRSLNPSAEYSLDKPGFIGVSDIINR